MNPGRGQTKVPRGRGTDTAPPYKINLLKEHCDWFIGNTFNNLPHDPRNVRVMQTLKRTELEVATSQNPPY